MFDLDFVKRGSIVKMYQSPALGVRVGGFGYANYAIPAQDFSGPMVGARDGLSRRLGFAEGI